MNPNTPLAVVMFEEKSPNLDAMYIYKSPYPIIDVGSSHIYLNHEHRAAQCVHIQALMSPIMFGFRCN